MNSQFTPYAVQVQQKRGYIYTDPNDSFPAANSVVYGYLQTQIENEFERFIIKIMALIPLEILQLVVAMVLVSQWVMEQAF